MSKTLSLLIFASLIAACSPPTTAADTSTQEERQELMEGVGKAAKPLGAMLKGEQEYDLATASASLTTFQDAAGKFAALFPEGTETGAETEAAPAIWEDRAGFEAALQDWSDATAAALSAAPADLDSAKPVLGAVFKTCKGCHDTYRIDN